MSASKIPWGPVNPNSQHQLWSRWTFSIFELGKRVPFADVRVNAARWLRKGFGSVGRAKVDKTMTGYEITLEVEGVPAHDPAYVASVKDEFQRHFVEKGWNAMTVGTADVAILAGDAQDGKPASQLVVMPSIA